MTAVPNSSAWKIRSTTTIYTDEWLTLQQEHACLPNGHHIPAYNIIKERDFCRIIALTTDGRIPLVRQYKHGAQCNVLEFPAGWWIQMRIPLRLLNASFSRKPVTKGLPVSA